MNKKKCKNDYAQNAKQEMIKSKRKREKVRRDQEKRKWKILNIEKQKKKKKKKAEKCLIRKKHEFKLRT